MTWLRLCCLLFWLPTLQAEIRVEDDMGRSLTLAAPAQRIASLAPHITELLFAAGLGDRVVAAVDYSDYPPAAKTIPRIGDASRIDLERLLSLKPDLIIAWGSGTPLREQQTLARLGVPLFLSEPRALPDIGRQMRVFGLLAGDIDTAAQAAGAYAARLRELQRRYARPTARRVFYQLALQPLLTVNDQHIIDAALSLCGGRNPFAELPDLTPSLSLEAVLAVRPEVILYAYYPGEDPAVTPAFWTAKGMSPSVRYLALEGDHIHRSTPRILEGVEQICRFLHAL